MRIPTIVLANRRFTVIRTLVLALTTFVPTVAGAADRQVVELAEGVWFVRHRGEGGNTTIVVGDRDVLVVDATGEVAAAKFDIEEIRRRTDKPVRYLLNTHWHGDHSTGNYLYAREFPGVAILAHQATKFEMDLLFPKGKERMYREIPQLKVDLRRTTDENGQPYPAEELEARRHELERIERIERDSVETVYTSPNVAFDSGLDIDLGGRVVHIRHLGRGNTAGDAVAWVPDAKVLAAGDLLVHPIPFMFDGYPTEWVTTLDRLAGFDAATIVPGHGVLLHDKQFIYLVRDFLQATIDQLDRRLADIGPAEFATFDQVDDAIDLSAFRARFVGEHPEYGENYDELVRRAKLLVFREAQLR